MIREEWVCQKYVDQKWVYNKVDADRFLECYGYEPDRIIPLSSFEPMHDRRYMSNTVDKSDITKILFVCSSYYVNIEGFKWFYTDVIPKLEKEYHVDVVGTGAIQLKSSMESEHVSFVGKVESMTPYYADADIVIAPVFDGGGMKVKTIEAISFAKCFISTSESLNGYWEVVPEGIRNNLIYKCDTKEEWISACNDLINKDVKKYNKEIYEVFREYFSYDSMLSEFQLCLPIVK